MQFIMRCSFKIHFKGADGSNRVQIALASRRTGHGVLCLGKDTLQKGWLKQVNTVQIILACRRSGHRVSVAEWQLILCALPSLVAVYNLLVIAATASACAMLS